MNRAIFAIGAVLSAATLPVSRAAIVVQELFDGMALNTAIGGQGGGPSSVGLTGVWAQNAGGAVISTANNFNLTASPTDLPGLPPQASGLGGVWKGGGNDWSTAIWATRPLATGLDFGADATYFFSFRINNTGDVAGGFGLAGGSAPASEFIGVGAHWNNQTDLASVQARNSLYTTWGTLDQNLVGNNDGPYAMRTHTAEGTINGRALVVGRLTTSAAGSDTLDVKMYFPGDSIDNDLGAISWSLTDSVNSSMNASHLLLWLNGSGNGELDAFRVGTTWTDVTGVTLVPEPGSALLAALGLGGAFLRRRRR